MTDQFPSSNVDWPNQISLENTTTGRFMSLSRVGLLTCSLTINIGLTTWTDRDAKEMFGSYACYLSQSEEKMMHSFRCPALQERVFHFWNVTPQWHTKPLRCVLCLDFRTLRGCECIAWTVCPLQLLNANEAIYRDTFLWWPQHSAFNKFVLCATSYRTLAVIANCLACCIYFSLGEWWRFVWRVASIYTRWHTV